MFGHRQGPNAHPFEAQLRLAPASSFIHSFCLHLTQEMELLARCLTGCEPLEIDRKCCVRIKELVPGYNAMGSGAQKKWRAELVSALRTLGQRQPAPPRGMIHSRKRLGGKLRGMLVVGLWAGDGGSTLSTLQQRAVECLKAAAQPAPAELPRAKRPRIGAACV